MGPAMLPDFGHGNGMFVLALERRTREQRMRDGVAVAGETWDAVRLLADELEVEVR